MPQSGPDSIDNSSGPRRLRSGEFETVACHRKWTLLDESRAISPHTDRKAGKLYELSVAG